MDTKAMSYDDIASALAITRESARQLVLRRGWTRTRGNDGRTVVSVPIEALARASDDTSDDTSDHSGQHPSEGTGQHPSVMEVTAVLARHIERLEAELAAAKGALATAITERDAERLRVAQVEGLRAVADAERDATRAVVVRIEAERDRWHAAATAPRGIAALLARFTGTRS